MMVSVVDTGGLQWFQLKPPLKERVHAPNQRQLVLRRAKITLKYG